MLAYVSLSVVLKMKQQRLFIWPADQVHLRQIAAGTEVG